MRNWFKKIALKELDVLVQRLSNDKDGEHICVSIRTYLYDASVCFHAEDDVIKADRMFDEFDEKEARKVLKMLNF